MRRAMAHRISGPLNPQWFVAVSVAVVLLAGAPWTESHAANPSGFWSRIYDTQPLLESPSGRRAAGYAYDSSRHRMIVFGGFPQYQNDVWAFDLTNGEWRPILPAGTPPSPRYGPTAIYDAAGDRLVVFGGFDGVAERNDAWALSLGGAPTWTALTPAGAPPAGRSFHVACYDAPRQRMVMFSGWNGTAFLGDTWQLSLGVTPEWTMLAPSGPLPPARNLAAVAYDSTRERMVVFGGWSGVYRSDTWALTLAGPPAWSEIAAPNPPPGRREISMAYDANDDRIVLFGGNSGSYLSDAWELPLSGAPDWQPLSTSGGPPAARYGHATIHDPTADRLVVFGGNGGGLHRADVWSLGLDGATNWIRMDPTAPRAARNYSAVLDPVAREMLVFGGATPSGLSQEMLAISLGPLPGARRVLALSTAPPSRRYAHRAVWDPVRDRMLVFGGYTDAGEFVNEVWEFRPRPQPSWSRLSPSGAAPSPRFAGGLVFDAVKDRVLAFGGYNTDVTGFVPAAWNDLWSLPLSGPGAMTWELLAPAGTPPAPRWGSSMVMDPSRNRALVFAGASATYDMYNDAFSLDLTPASAAWTTLAPSGALPSARVIHASVLDPVHDRLVIFGGFDNSNILNDVHALSLSGTLAWAPLAPEGDPPGPRDAVAAVYDAAAMRMVVFGGFGGGLAYWSDTWALTWDVVVPALVSLASTHAEPGLVRVTWLVPDAASVQAQVERREDASAWRTLGPAQRVSEDQLVIEDRAVLAGERYVYRLRLRSGGEETISETAEVTVPSGFAFALAGAEPNPATGERLQVAFALPRRMRAQLDLIDLSGRRVASREVGALGAGRHRVTLGEDARLAPGLYVVRLDTDEGAIVKRACIVR